MEGKQHPDRDARYRHISETVATVIAVGQPAISIDTKRKELVGEFENAGREWHPEGQAPKVNTYDFPSMAKGKAIPYGVHDIAEDTDSSRSGSTATPAILRAPESGDVDVIVNYTNCIQCGAITAKGGRLTTPEGGDGPLYQNT